MDFRKPQLLILTTLLFLLMGCTSIQLSELGKLPHGADSHAVGKAWGLYKFNVSSYSDINHSAEQRKPLSSLQLKEVTSGKYLGFKWSVFSTGHTYDYASRFQRPQFFFKREAAGTVRKITIPSWQQSFKSLINLIHVIIGTDAPPFNLRINLIGQDVEITDSETIHSDAAVPLEFSLPVVVGKSANQTGYNWLIDTLSTPAHEYLHTYFFYAAKQSPLNTFSNEVAAYTFQWCIEVGLMRGQGGLTFNAYGKPVELNKLPATLVVNRKSNLVFPLSNNGSLYSVYNIVHYLGTSKIKRDDIKTRNKFFGLCAAMIHHPVDLTKEYYPKIRQ